jgi:transposase InsO family protein
MMSRQSTLTIERMCQLAQVGRAGYYRFLEQSKTTEEVLTEEMELRSLIQQIALFHRRRYGYRRMVGELRDRGYRINHKRVLRLMREDNLLSLRRRKFVVTTDSRHHLQVGFNLASRMKLTGINQLWIADITYIRLQQEFVYLAVLLDAFSRKAIGWALDRSMTTALTLTALRKAIAERQPPPGVVHHSDRGLQYASADYVRVLRQHGMELSMSRAGNPYDNATCESFIKTLKVEEVDVTEYRDLEHLVGNLQIFMEQYYNRLRLHSALNYRSPEKFEQQLAAMPTSNSTQAAVLSFLGHGQSINAMGSNPSQSQDHSPTHCVDESPAGYSWAGCSPAEPACASPAGPSVEQKEEPKEEKNIKRQV